MIILRTPKGWTGPRDVDGQQVEGTFRAHQVPLAGVRDNPEHLAQLAAWLRSYRPGGAVRRHRRAGRRGRRRCRRRGDAADERQPGRQRRHACCATWRCRTSATTRSTWTGRGAPVAGATGADRAVDPRRDRGQPATGSGCSVPDEVASNRLDAVFEVTDRAFVGETVPGRRAPRARRPGDGGALRAPVPGLAGGLPADRPARRVHQLRGVHPHRRLDGQPARQMAEGHPATSPGAARSPR